MADPAKKSKYWKKYYADKGEELKARRRKKYAENKEYREKQLQHTKDSRKRRREGGDAGIRVNGRPSGVTAFVPGLGDVTVYSIGVLADELGKSIVTLRLWERKGILPATLIRNGKGDRHYTQGMIDVVVSVMGSRTWPKPMPVEEINGLITDGWARIGIAV